MTISKTLKEVIDQLGYDFSQFELAHFIQHIEQLQRREILVMALPFEPGLSALWIRAETADYIFYNARTHPVHQLHNILHELAHIILNHSCHAIDQALPPDILSLTRAAHPQGRLRKADPHLRMDQEEREAEAFVFLIQKRLMAANRMNRLMGQSSSINALRRWVDSMAFDE